MKKDSYIPLPREEYALADMLQTERELLHLYAAALGEGFSGGLRTLLTEKFLEGSEDAKRIADERALRRGREPQPEAADLSEAFSRMYKDIGRRD